MSQASKAAVVACIVVLLAATGARAQSSPQGEAITAPVTRVGNAILIQAEIAEGKPAALLVDSGASATLVLDVNMAKQSHLGTSGRAILRGAGKSQCAVAKLSAGQVVIDKKTFSAPDSFVVDLSRPSSFLKRKLDGVVGGDLFRHQVVTLDFSRSSIRFSPIPIPTQPEEERMPMFPLVGNLCCAVEADLQVNGRTIHGRFALDTGSPTIDVALTRKFAERAKLLPWRNRGRVVKLPALCGTTALGEFRRPVSLKLGERQMPVDLWIGLDREGALNAASFDGIIGGNLLSRFHEITFDAPNKSLVLKR